jgi:hypothetical protein
MLGYLYILPVVFLKHYTTIHLGIEYFNDCVFIRKDYIQNYLTLLAGIPVGSTNMTTTL